MRGSGRIEALQLRQLDQYIIAVSKNLSGSELDELGRGLRSLRREPGLFVDEDVRRAAGAQRFLCELGMPRHVGKRNRQSSVLRGKETAVAIEEPCVVP